MIRRIERIAGVFEIYRFSLKTVILKEKIQQFHIAHNSILPRTGICSSIRIPIPKTKNENDGQRLSADVSTLMLMQKKNHHFAEVNQKLKHLSPSLKCSSRHIS